MKQYFHLLLLLPLFCDAQSWQWGKRGGAFDEMPGGGDASLTYRREQVYSMATDSQRNVYVLSAVGITSLDIDGVPKTNFGDSNSRQDITLASFACDGTYRWSKIIGGGGQEVVPTLQLDAEDNAYVAGKFANSNDDFYPPRIDDDVILSVDYQHSSMLFIVKYAPDGVMQWFKRPQPDDTPIENGLLKTRSFALAMDKTTSTAYWLVEIPDGPIGDGAFVNTSGLKFFILKYNAQGNLTGTIGPLDIQYNGGYIGTLHFYRNPYNGYFYMYAMKDSSAATITLGGQTTDKCFLLACFDDQGQFQWMRTDTTTNVYYSCLFDLAFDTDNSIYIAGRLSINNIDSFLGVSSNTNINPPFVMKTDPTASNVIWSSYANKNADNCGGIALNGDEVGFAGRANAANFTWGSQVLNVNTIGEGSEALLARFNKTTGACIALTKIPGDAGYDDVGSALTVDAAGDYLFGGGIGHQMTFASGDIYNDGLQTDFFVAKYATAPCQPLALDDNQNDGFGLYPNPVGEQMVVRSTTQARYLLIDMTGKQLARGSLSEGENILPTASLPPGVYLLKIQNQETAATLRVVKK